MADSEYHFSRNLVSREDVGTVERIEEVGY